MESRKVLIARSRWPRNWWGHRTYMYNLRWDEESSYLIALLGYRDAGEALRGVVDRLYKYYFYDDWRLMCSLRESDKQAWLEVSCLRWQFAWLEHRGEVGRRRFFRMVEKGIGVVVAEGMGEDRSLRRKSKRAGRVHRTFKIWQETLWQWWQVKGLLKDGMQDLSKALKVGLWKEFECRMPRLAKEVGMLGWQARLDALGRMARQAGWREDFEKAIVPDGKGCQAGIEVEGGSDGRSVDV